MMLETQNAPLSEGELVLEGSRFLCSGDPKTAEDYWRQAVEKNPFCLAGWVCLTDLYISQQRRQDAIPCLQRLISGCDKTADVLATLAEKSWQLRLLDQARDLANLAFEREPSQQTMGALMLVLAKVDYMAENWESALIKSSEVLKTQPPSLEALQIRQKCWQKLSYALEDVADCRAILALQPSALYHSDLLFLLNFLHDTTPELLFDESRRWNTLYADPLATSRPRLNNGAQPERKLKIGLLSSDFRHHPLMKLLPPVLERHDKEHFEIYLYAVSNKADDVTDYVRRTVPNFVELEADRNVIVNRIVADGIDILVDLGGHTQPLEALMALALKPAPIQVSWMGVHATTGLSTMDYFIGDEQMPCPGTEHLFSEKIYRLKHAQYCYRPFGDPGLSASPSLQYGYITFGCFNKPRKITREMVKVWSVILHLNPESKMLLKYEGYERPTIRDRILRWFVEDGVLADRLIFEGQSDAIGFLSSLNRVDISLDTFPYNGGTTTLETLWMGVPVVAMQGRLAVSRCSASFLNALGFPVATSVEQYVSLAGQLVSAIPATPYLRRQIRAALMKSPLMDEQGLVREMEEAFRNIWHSWCATQPLSV